MTQTVQFEGTRQQFPDDFTQADISAQRSAAGRVPRSSYRSPAQNAAEARFVEQMGHYGALASRTLAAGNAGAPAQ
jgi:hypothetical protein